MTHSPISFYIKAKALHYHYSQWMSKGKIIQIGKLQTERRIQLLVSDQERKHLYIQTKINK